MNPKRDSQLYANLLKGTLLALPAVALGHRHIPNDLCCFIALTRDNSKGLDEFKIILKQTYNLCSLGHFWKKYCPMDIDSMTNVVKLDRLRFRAFLPSKT